MTACGLHEEMSHQLQIVGMYVDVSQASQRQNCDHKTDKVASYLLKVNRYCTVNSIVVAEADYYFIEHLLLHYF